MEETLKLIKEASTDYERYKIISNLNSKELKLKYIFFVKSESYRALIILNIKDDNVKIQFLKTFKDEYNRYLIIKSFSKEELKQKYLYFITNEHYKSEIIKSFTSDEYKENILNSFNTSYYKAIIISSFSNDELKKKYFSSLNKKELLIVLVSLKNDIDKIKYLTLFIDDEDKEKIINSFKNDELKLKYLNYLSDEAKIRIIANFKDYDKMNEALNNIKDYIVKISITQYLNDDSKLNLISRNTGKFYIDLIASLENEKLKLSYLNDIDNSFYQLIILISMSDSIKGQYITTFNLYEERIALIYSVQDINKRNYYRKLYEKKLSFDLGLDKELQFGLEIETEGINSIIIKKWEFSNTSFRGENDGTLINGVEIKTPKLINCSYNINELYNVCNMLYYGGFSCSYRTGGHIHYDASYFEKKEDYYGLLEIWSNAEEIFYLIGNDTFDFPRKDVNIFATTFFMGTEEQLDNDVIKSSFNLDSKEFIDNIHNWQINKFNGLNLIHIKNGINTIEFRVSNGTIKFSVWIQNIKLFGRLMMVSKKLSKIYQGYFIDELTNNLWLLKESLKNNISKDEKMEILLKMLFNKHEREVYRKRYYANKNGANRLAKMEFKGLSLKRNKNNRWYL